MAKSDGSTPRVNAPAEGPPCKTSGGAKTVHWPGPAPTWLKLAKSITPSENSFLAGVDLLTAADQAHQSECLAIKSKSRAGSEAVRLNLS